MVISSTNTDVGSPAQSESSESVEEPPIRKNREPNLAVKPEFRDHESLVTVTGIDVCTDAHILDVKHVATQLGVEVSHGLSTHEATARLAKDGPNKLKDTERISIFQIFMRQVSNSLTVVLLITMVLSFSLNDYIEGSVIAAVILLNIVVGFFQDYRAEQTILSLQALSTPECKVLRDSQVKVVKVETLVVGDVVQLSAGGVVPADLRLFDSVNLSTDEALLTGESLPVSKYPDKALRTLDMPIGDRTNMAYSASMVARGRGSGIVVATGMQTEVGKIASLLRDRPNSSSEGSSLKCCWNRFVQGTKHALGLIGSPLQVQLSKFALLLFALAILLALIVFSANVWDVRDEVLIYGICVAVAVIPESLIAVLTLTIAVGTKAMAKTNIIIRRLSALEAVGGVTNVCSDKTGTLTQGKMIVRRAVLANGETITVHDTTDPFDPTSGTIQQETSSTSNSEKVDDNVDLDLFLDVISLCNLSTVQDLQKTDPDAAAKLNSSVGRWTTVGEPTEIALQVFAMRFQHGKPEAVAKRRRKLVHEFPFDSSIKRMTMAYTRNSADSIDVFAKGATEALLPIMTCTEEEKTKVSHNAERMASEGLRVLCLANKTVPLGERAQLADRSVAESNLTFCGLVGMYDPPRAQTAEAVRTCHRAGITVHMLTGDHIRTATAIAGEVGIIDGTSLLSPVSMDRRVVMPASAFDKLSNEEIDKLDELPLVIARCSPTTKVRMVQALHRRRGFCIMTGDGINDSPALKLADIGIAMGLNGSDVAKQAADMVLADDDFASIFLLHLLTSNIAQVVLLLIGLAFKDHNDNSVFPLSPLEILWANLVTSSPLALGLGLEPGVRDIMNRPPRSMRVGVFTKQLILDKMVYGVTMGTLCLLGFVSVVYGTGNGDLGEECNEDYNFTCDVVFKARATVFAILSFTLLATAWEVKDFNASLFNMGHHHTNAANSQRSKRILSVFSTVYQNKFLFWACVSGFALVFPLIYLPEVNKRVFKHSGISYEWGIVFGGLLLYVLVIECWKAIKRWRLRKAQRSVGMNSSANTSSKEVASV
ncbi:potassium/sodium efflux P-type ATPase, fungal-type [Rhinocladiella mackenziei CBS 650.93]|uniref:Sodium/potassium exporting P-type ATPase 1 n=1 Tax=Rhinocladiella mackenziei CBS 650.93 TaxID=1442369 RepID=A0A0D2I3G0_9EURO|nr:potassium/sodium efflux P-type ATPase, fungal-type [Rhinocladiella mackenziei CBS 650.93]KIX00309.1 potassium/sodium efflux P-type ATPase, fungal-type [Rhinocladiella mackenziei CBS 650.93]